MPVILATQEADIRRTAVQCQLGQIVNEPLSPKILSHKMAGGVALSSKPSTTKKQTARLCTGHVTWA
jgi:hypothetical protein